MTGKRPSPKVGFVEALGQEIRRIRRDRDLTQDELATAADISIGTMKTIERTGPVRVDHTARIARALDIPFDVLVRRATMVERGEDPGDVRWGHTEPRGHTETA